MRIFIGLTDVANITANFSKGFKELGHEVFTVVWNKSQFYLDSDYDVVIDDRIPGSLLRNAFSAYVRMLARLAGVFRGLNCDVYVLYAPAVLPTYLYYPILKFFGRKIITAYWGSDIRYWYAFAEEMRSLKADGEMFPFFDYAKNRTGGSYWDKARTIKTAEKYSDLILSQPDCAQLQSRPYMRAGVPLILSEYTFNVPARAVPLILHAPSDPAAKGTDVILRVIQELKEEGLQFEFRLIDQMPNKKLRELLSTSDIVVDELYSATVAALSAEAMATGNVVLVRYMADYSKVPAGCPAINTNIFTLKDNLRQVIMDVELRKELAQRGRSYVEAVNDHVKICRDMLDWLEQKDTLQYDFYPTFHKTLNIPQGILEDEKKESGRKRKEFFKTLLSTGDTTKKQ